MKIENDPHCIKHLGFLIRKSYVARALVKTFNAMFSFLSARRGLRNMLWLKQNKKLHSDSLIELLNYLLPSRLCNNFNVFFCYAL